MKSYEWAEGARFKSDPEKAAEVLLRIQGETGGIAPHDVVREAKPESSPLHADFQWDDAVAANEHRLYTARNLIRAIRIHTVNGKDRMERLFVHTTIDEARYVSLEIAARRPDVMADIIAQALAGLRSWQARFSELSGFKSVSRIIGKTLDKFDKRDAASNGRRPRTRNQPGRQRGKHGIRKAGKRHDHRPKLSVRGDRPGGDQPLRPA